VAIVSGGTHGIGAACVERLAADGYAVVFSGRDDATGAALEGRTPGATFIHCDVTSPSDIERTVDAALRLGEGSIAAVVNNAGATLRSAFHETTVDDWDRLFATNARSAYLLTRHAIEGLIAGRGAVVFISSVAGKAGEEGLALYSATKGALLALTQSLALEYGDRVRFNAVCPGQIATRMMSRVVEDDARLRATTARIPVGRLGTARDVASAVCWLLSSDSAFVNGAVLTVDGGETAGIRLTRTGGWQ
jgi:NAD(P)-dependent dehydrogenase (short-subunit alcohol dehydrogenase family)